MKNENVQINRVDGSDFVCDVAADIDACRRSLMILSDRIDDLPNEHSLVILVTEKLEQITAKLNEVDGRLFREIS